MKNILKNLIENLDNYKFIDSSNNHNTNSENTNISNINVQIRFEEYKNNAYIQNIMDENADILLNIDKNETLDICFRKSNKLTDNEITKFVNKVKCFINLKERENCIWDTPFAHYKFIKE